MFDAALGRLSSDLAVDLGSTTIRILAKGRGPLVQEPSVVAIQQVGSSTRVVAVGEDAHRMVGRTPEHITAAHPIVGGRVDDFQLAEALLVHCVKQVQGSRGLLKSRMIISVSQGTTEVERRAIQESARAAGIRDVHLVGHAIAASLGVGLPIQDAGANIVIDLGGGTTQASLLSLGAVVDSISLPFGGLALDEALVAWVRARHGILISRRSAEEIKRQVGAALKGVRDSTTQVKGRDLTSGIPKDLVVHTRDTVAAFKPVLDQLVQGLAQLFGRTTPELSADALERGLVLSGGTALLPGMEEFLRSSTGLPVLLAEEPLLAVVNGAAMVLDDSALLERVAL